MRTEQRPSLATGHLNIPLTQNTEEGNDLRGNLITQDLNKVTTELILKIKQIIERV